MHTLAVFDDDQITTKMVCGLAAKLLPQYKIVAQGENLVEASFKVAYYKPDAVIIDFRFNNGGTCGQIAKVLKKYVHDVIILTVEDPESIRRKNPELRFCNIIQKPNIIKALLELR